MSRLDSTAFLRRFVMRAAKGAKRIAVVKNQSYFIKYSFKV